MKKTVKLIACLIVCAMALTMLASCDIVLHTYDNGNYDYDESYHWLCCDSEACDSTTQYEEHMPDYDQPYFEDIDGDVYCCYDCFCGYTEKELLDNTYLVTDTESAQAALDAAVDGTTIYLLDGEYGVLYIRQTEDSIPVESNWAGGGHTFKREINNVTVKAVGENVSVKSIKLEALTYTPDGNQHSNSAGVPYLNSYININGLEIVGITFDLEENGLAVDFAHCNTEINGLTVDSCVVNGNNGTGKLLYSTADVFNEVQLINVEFNELDQGINVNDVQRLLVQSCTFNAVKNRDILITGPVSGNVVVINNTSKGGTERFMRLSALTASAYVQVSGNTVTDYQGADTDIIKITGAVGAQVSVFNNDWDGTDDSTAMAEGIVTVSLS